VIFAWLAWPLVYLAYSLVRGAVVDWYPYPFLDPDESGGYAGVAGYALAILAAFTAVGLALHWWATHERRAGARTPALARPRQGDW
jgi:membrane protease YdiL (CAAX protease family)